jgi:hypothetical protein
MRRGATQVRLTNMIAYTSTIMDTLRPARISERRIDSLSPFRAPSNQEFSAVPLPHLPAKRRGLDGASRQKNIGVNVTLFSALRRCMKGNIRDHAVSDKSAPQKARSSPTACS